MGIKDKAVSGVKWNTVATVYGMVIQLLRIAILTRLLEKSDFGIVAIAAMVISFTDIFSDLGLTVAIIHKQDVTKNQFSSLYWMNLFTSTILFAGVALSSPIFSRFYNEPILTTIIPLLGIQIFLNAFGKLFQTIKTRNLEFKFLSLVKITSYTIGFITTTVLAYLGLGVYSLVIGQLVQVAINQLCYTIAGSKEIKISFHFNYSEISEFIKIGVYQLGANFLDFVSNKIDVFLIGRFFGMADLGIYNLAKDLILKPKQIISTLINSVVSAAFAKIQSNLALVRETYVKMADLVSFITVPIYILMAVYAESIVTIIYSADYLEVAALLRILSFVGLLSSIDSLAATIIMAFGRTEIGLIWTTVRVVLSIVTILIASSMSISAVAYGLLIVAIISFVLYWRFAIYQIIKLKLSDYVRSIMYNVFIAVSLAALFALTKSFLPGNITCDIIQMTVFLSLYLLIIMLYRKSIKESVKQLLRRNVS